MLKLQRALLILGFPVLAIVAAALYAPPAETPAENYLKKFDREGRAISAWSGPWSCVCDTRTNLLWEVKTDDEGVHDGSWTYSWLQSVSEASVGVANSGDCYYEPDRCDTEDLMRHTNEETLCGVDTWRLPSVSELQSLVFAQAHAGKPLIDTDYFPMSKRGDYWTQESEQPLHGTYQYLNTGGAAIEFISGTKVTIPYRNAAFARLVSSMSRNCHLISQ